MFSSFVQDRCALTYRSHKSYWNTEGSASHYPNTQQIINFTRGCCTEQAGAFSSKFIGFSAWK